MRLSFLGTGAAGGVPLYGCDCPACRRAASSVPHQRQPCSALIEADGTRILIDAGLCDLHQRFPPGTLDAIVLTHYHPDHVQGLFHLRWGKGEVLPVYGPPDSQGCADLFKHPGVLAFHAQRKFVPFRIGTLRLTPLPLQHSKVTFGYAIESAGATRLAYLTDTLGLPPKTGAFLRQWGRFAMAIDCTHPPRQAPSNHNDWHAALACIERSGAQRAWLTHIGHELDSWLLAQQPGLPEGVCVASDGDCHELDV
ncbi:MAG: phosphonate metabolism protein PhnP [Chromatiales bacterium]|nr:phosphonate metabolism protein PhnP [Gammaproteobacteria bacterium]MBW6476935.1 phosphonate metabolism protein PhnP [Chromatiales bacterium]